jgi:hypothetical protein
MGIFMMKKRILDNKKTNQIFWKILVVMFIPTCFINTSKSDDVSYTKAKELLVKIKENNGVAPHVDDYYNIVIDNKTLTLTNSESKKLWFDLLELQNPSIKVTDLLKLVDAKRKSIQSFYCRLRYIHENKGADNIPPSNSFYHEYAIKGNKFYVDVDCPNKKNFRNIFSYDGEKTYYATGFREKSPPTISINPLSSRDPSFLSPSPLCQAMLFDTKHAGLQFPIYDLMLCGNMTVFEKK